MANKYNHLESEAKWQAFREEHQFYAFDKESDKPVYSIDTPPPTVSGKIHIGHIFSYTQAEVIARFKRMSGYNVFYPFGFDDNGLPTERLVEKEIGKKGSEMPRQEFVAQCLDVTKHYREVFKDLWKSVGISADWNLEYSTISPAVQKTSQKSFLDLYEKWAMYKKNAPALRCTECQTGVAQAEVEDKEFESVFYDIQFSLEDGSPLIIATTRPELLPACVAVFVNKEDPRYQHLIGKNVITPLGTKVPMLSDEKVGIDKGTGVVMCCTYGDETDMYWVKTYELPEKIILDKAGTLINTGVPALDGLKCKAARKVLVEQLKSEGKILKELPIKHNVGTHERDGVPMEIIPVAQWFIAVLPIKNQITEAGNQINWYPDHMKKRFDEWVENLKWDRCVSRQRFYGIPIPVRYSKITGETILPDADQLPVNPITDRPNTLPAGHTYEDIIPETDVLDTWATSSLTPQINSKRGEADSLEDKIFPMSLRPQAHDIIRTWAFYTIVKSIYHNNTIPRSDIMISGHVLAAKGEKLSKSKNNGGAEPTDLIRDHSADAIRYRTCSASLGKNAVFEESEIQNGKKLVTKLRNAANFVFMNLADFDRTTALDESQLAPIDLRLFNQANQTSEAMSKHLSEYEFGLARIAFEKFFWHDFCDHYLEIVKDKIYKFDKYENGTAEKNSAQFTLYQSLYAILRMIAPILPFITEELYQTHYQTENNGTSIHQADFPNGDIYPISQNIDRITTTVDQLFSVIEKTRGFKTENKLGLGTELAEIKILCDEKTGEYLSKMTNDIKSVTRAQSVSFEIAPELDIQITQIPPIA